MHYLKIEYADIKAALHAHGYGQDAPLVDIVLRRAVEIFGKIVSPLDISVELRGTKHSHLVIDLDPLMPHTDHDGSTILSLHHSEWSHV